MAESGLFRRALGGFASSFGRRRSSKRSASACANGLVTAIPFAASSIAMYVLGWIATEPKSRDASRRLHAVARRLAARGLAPTLLSIFALSSAAASMQFARRSDAASLLAGRRGRALSMVNSLGPSRFVALYHRLGEGRDRRLRARSRVLSLGPETARSWRPCMANARVQ